MPGCPESVCAGYDEPDGEPLSRDPAEHIAGIREDRGPVQRGLGTDGSGRVWGVRRALCGEEVQGMRAAGKAERMMDLGACISQDKNEKLLRTDGLDSRNIVKH